MEDIAIRLGFVLVVAALIAINWRADMARSGASRVGLWVVRSSRPGRATSTLRAKRALGTDRKEE
jgi:hypothetical protein